MQNAGHINSVLTCTHMLEAHLGHSLPSVYHIEMSKSGTRGLQALVLISFGQESFPGNCVNNTYKILQIHDKFM